MEVENRIDTQDELQKYYEYLYPANLLCSWFGYFKSETSSNMLLMRRQFSMTIVVGKDEIYKRFLSYKSAREFQAALKNDIPIKMDIGAIYEEIPKKGAPNTPQQKEFIIDIDIDSYDNVRTCCQGADICNDCWKLMKIAAKILYRTMEQDFGYKDMLFVFSGRRGIHLWVCDERARNMADVLRRSIMEYMYLVTGNEQSASQLADNVLSEKLVAGFKINDRAQLRQMLHRRQIHPFVAKSLAIIENDFLALLKQQKILENEKRRAVVEKILSRRSDRLLENVQARWSKCKNSVQMFSAIQQELQSYERYTNEYKQKKIIPPLDKDNTIQTASFIEEEIMLTFMYPRLDINVSTAKNHLLKCPFSVHPKTKKISIPFDFESVDRFDPVNCITLPELLKEANELLEQNGGQQRYPTPESLAAETKGLSGPITILQRFVNNTLKRLKRQEPSLQF